MTKRVLITGVAGLLGSRLAQWLSENTNHEIIGVDDLSGGYRENVCSNVKFYEFNLVNLDRVRSLFEKEKPNIVYHFAAYAADRGNTDVYAEKTAQSMKSMDKSFIE